MRRRRNEYKFTEKSHSKLGIISFSIGTVLVLLYIIFIYLSYKMAGNLSTYYGSAGVFAMLVSVVTLVLSIRSILEEDSFKIFPRMALGTSFVAVLCWMGTYIIGYM